MILEDSLREIAEAWRQFDDAREADVKADFAHGALCEKYARRPERTSQSDTLAMREALNVAKVVLEDTGRKHDSASERLIGVLDRIFGSAK